MSPDRTPTVHQCLYGGRPWVAHNSTVQQYDVMHITTNVSILSCIQTRFSRLRPRPRTRTRPSHYNTVQPNTTPGWLFASGSSWTLGHTGASKQDTHGTLVPGREGRGGPQLAPRQTTARQTTSLETNVLSANRRLEKRAVQQPGADSHLESHMVEEQRDDHVASAQ